MSDRCTRATDRPTGAGAQIRQDANHLGESHIGVRIVATLRVEALLHETERSPSSREQR